jgi:hypothetical protein
LSSSETYHLVFIAANIACVGFFAVRKKVDPLLVGLLASLIYFSPGLIGEISFSYGAPAGTYRSTIMPGSYIAMLIVLGSITFAAALFDRCNVPKNSTIHVNLPFLSHILAGLALVSLIISVSTVGKGYLCTEKTDVLARIDGWYYIAAYAAPLAFACGLAVRAWGVVVLSSFILLADIFVGFRAGVSVALISFGLLSGHWLRQGVRKKIIFLFIVLSAGAGLFVIKQLAWNIKYAASVPCEKLTADAWPAVQHEVNAENTNVDAMPIHVRSEQFLRLAALLTEAKTYVAAFRYAEPMVTQSILNEVVRSGFQTPPSYVLDHILSAVPGGRTLFGIDVSQTPTFNETFQKILFPLATFGMASNPWAQAYSAGGYAMVGFFSLVYSVLLVVFTILFARFDGPIRGSVAVLSGWWGFYAHRIDVLIEFGIIKMVVYIFVVASLISVGLMFAKRKFFRSENR